MSNQLQLLLHKLISTICTADVDAFCELMADPNFDLAVKNRLPLDVTKTAVDDTPIRIPWAGIVRLTTPMTLNSVGPHSELRRIRHLLLANATICSDIATVNRVTLESYAYYQKSWEILQLLVDYRRITRVNPITADFIQQCFYVEYLKCYAQCDRKAQYSTVKSAYIQEIRRLRLRAAGGLRPQPPSELTVVTYTLAEPHVARAQLLCISSFLHCILLVRGAEPNSRPHTDLLLKAVLMNASVVPRLPKDVCGYRAHHMKQLLSHDKFEMHEMSTRYEDNGVLDPDIL